MPQAGDKRPLPIGLRLVAFALSGMTLFTAQSCIFGGDEKRSPPPITRGYYSISLATIGPRPVATTRLNYDSAYTIRWNRADSILAAGVHIQLYKGDTLIFSIARDSVAMGDTGSQSWNLAAVRPPGGSGPNYRLKITSVSDSTEWDYSPPFTIYSNYNGSLYIQSPNSYAVGLFGSSLQINWTSSGNAGSRVGLSVYRGDTLLQFIDSSNIFSGYYNWVISGGSITTSGNYRIRVASLSDPAIFARSPLFRINRPYYGTLGITLPTTGSVFSAGANANIAWTSTGSPGSTLNLQLFRDSSRVLNIISGISRSNSSYFWFVPPGMETSSRYRIRILSAQDTGISAFSGYFTLNGVAPDAFEPDNQRISAAPLTDTISQARTLTQLDTDWVRIDAVRSRAYTAAFQSGFTLVVTLTDSSGNFLNSYSGMNQLIQIAAGYTGRYYLRVQYYLTSSGYQGPYSISLRSFLPAIDFTAPVAGAVLSAGIPQNISWAPDSGVFGSALNLQLYRDSVFVQSISTGTSNDGFHTWTPPVNLTTSGDYRIRAENYLNTQLFAYGPAFTINGLMPDVFEADNDRLSAKILPDSAIQSRTLTTSDTDWIQFDVTPGRKYLAALRNNFTVWAQVTDSNGLVLNSYSGFNLQIVITPAYVGRQYLRIQPYSTGIGYQGPYTVALTAFDAQAGLSLTFTSPTPGTIFAAGSTYRIGWVPDSLNFSGVVALNLYRDTILVQNIITGASNGGAFDWTLPTNLTTGANYRIRLSNYGNAQIFSQGPEFSISGINPDGFEPDNVRPSARVITDSAVQARTLTVSDTDWVLVNAQPGRRYMVQIQSAFNISASILDSNGTLVSASNLANPQLFITPSSAGRYYIRIQNYSTSSGYQGAYSLTLRGYDAQTGFPSLFSFPLAGAMLTAGTTASIRWAPDSSLYGASIGFALYRDAVLLQYLVSSTPNDGDYSWAIPSTITTGADYRIRAYRDGNPQVFSTGPLFTINGITPDAYEPDNARPEAKLISDGATQPRTLTTLDSDWVQINTVAGKRYLAAVQSGFWVNAHVLDSNGIILNGYAGNNLQIFLTPAYAGRHYLRILFYSTAAGYQGPYNLNLREFDGQSGFPVTFTVPAPGAVLNSGSSHALAWVRDSALFGGTVSLQLFRDSAQILSVAASTANSGTYSWSIPAGLVSDANYRLRMASLANANVFGLSSNFSISGMAPDSLEPNDIAGNSSLLTATAEAPLTLTYLDRDWFRFTGIVGRLYVLRTRSAITTTVALHSGLGAATLATTVKAVGDSVNSVAWVCPQDGQYSFQVTAAAPGPYTLEFQEFTAAGLTVVVPAAGDTLTRNQRVTVQWTSQADLRDSVDIFLYGISGLAGTLAVKAVNTGSFNWIVPDSVALPSGDGYSIRVISRIHSSLIGNSGLFRIANRVCTGAACPPNLTLADFESGDGGFVSTGPNSWQWGSPTYAGGPQAGHSGSRVWGTRLDSAYSNSAVYTLTSSSFTVPASASLYFWHWLSKESACCDYGYVEISVDNGATFTNLATFSIGTTAGWAQAVYSLTTYAGRIAVVRWRFTSDANISLPGWFIDDVEVR